MKNVILALVVAFALGILAVPVAAQNPYQPLRSKLIEVSVPAVLVGNPTGALTIAVGTPVTSPSATGNLVGCLPAFPPVSVNCSAFTSSAQLAQAIIAGLAQNANAAGYVVVPGAGPSTNGRISIGGPAVPGHDTFWVFVFHGEIDPILGLTVEPGYPITNLCDGVMGNEQLPSTGNGITVKAVTIADDPFWVGSFEAWAGYVVPPNWAWDAVGQVSVEPSQFLSVPTAGFPTQGSFFLRLSTEDPVNTHGLLKIATSFRYSSSFPVLRFSYRWFNGEGGVNLSANDTFVARLSTRYWSVEIAREDTTTPLSAGVRTVEADMRELFWFANEGDLITIEFDLWNSGCCGGPANDSVVFIDDLSFPLPQAGEGNAVYPYGPSFRLETASWDLVRGLSQMSAADKRVAPGGALVLNFMLTQWGGPAGFPFVLMGSFVPYGGQPVTSLPGEPGVIGLDLGNAFPIWSGVWGPGYPMIPFFLPPGILLPDGLYVQGGILDASAPNGIRVSNRIRHRVE